MKNNREHYSEYLIERIAKKVFKIPKMHLNNADELFSKLALFDFREYKRAMNIIVEN